MAVSARTKRGLDSDEHAHPSKLLRDDSNGDVGAAAAASTIVRADMSDAAGAAVADPTDADGASPTSPSVFHTHRQVCDLDNDDDDSVSVTNLDDDVSFHSRANGDASV